MPIVHVWPPLPSAKAIHTGDRVMVRATGGAASEAVVLMLVGTTRECWWGNLAPDDVVTDEDGAVVELAAAASIGDFTRYPPGDYALIRLETNVAGRPLKSPARRKPGTGKTKQRPRRRRSVPRLKR